jgi:pimeloyl-ACP methyl ester carboxylesterase
MRALAERGFAVLRFDYYGTGDSPGSLEQSSLELWEANIKSAVSALKKRSSVTQVSLCGLRLGARLALHVSDDIALRRLVLWDPILDGTAYVQRLEMAHQQMLHRLPHEAPMPSPLYKTPQCWGFPWPQSLRTELSRWQADRIQTSCQHITGVLSSLEPTWPALVQKLKAAGIEVQEHRIEPKLFWDDDRVMKIRCFPNAHLKSICQALEGGS